MIATGELYLKIGNEVEAAKASLRFWTFGLAEAELEWACKNHSVHRKIYDPSFDDEKLQCLMDKRKKAKKALDVAQDTKESWATKVRTLSIMYSSLSI
jgi:hypothetical protein